MKQQQQCKDDDRCCTNCAQRKKWEAAAQRRHGLSKSLMLFSSAKCSIVSISSPSLSSLSPLSLLSYLSLSSCQLADGVAITDGVVLGGVHDHGARVVRIGRGQLACRA